MLDIEMCHAIVYACTSYRHLASCSLIPQSCGGPLLTSCCVTCCPEKPCLTWLGFDSVLYFTYPELKPL